MLEAEDGCQRDGVCRAAELPVALYIRWGNTKGFGPCAETTTKFIYFVFLIARVQMGLC